MAQTQPFPKPEKTISQTQHPVIVGAPHERHRVLAPGSDPGYQAYQTLHAAYVIAPLIAGLDKFANLLTRWTDYLAPVVSNTLHVNPQSFMRGVGVVEIVAGIGVALKPRIFGYVVALWLGGIIVNLLLTGHYYDIALRDFGLGLGALALARLAQKYEGLKPGRQSIGASQDLT